MKSKEDQKPAIQVLERMFSLLDLLASHQDPVSLKLISEQTGLQVVGNLSESDFQNWHARFLGATRELPALQSTDP